MNWSAGNKHLVLVFPPFVFSTSPPLGICSLKGYLQQAAPDWSVRTVDLNLMNLGRLLDQVAGGMPLDKKVFPEGLLGEIALCHIENVFRGRNGRVETFFKRGDRYTIYADLFQRFVYGHMFNYQFLQQAVEGQAQMPKVIEQWAEMILKENPTVIGLSLCYTQQVWYGLCLAKAIRARSAVPIIAGGTFFNSNGPRFLQDHGDLVDFVLCGEAELGLAELLNNWGNPKAVPGLMQIKDGELLANEPAYEKHLDQLGNPDFSDLRLDDYFSPETVLPVLTSRGCYWRKCAFCAHYKSAGLTYRRRSIDHVIGELKSRVAEGIQYFSFVDEMISAKHFGELSKAILDSGLDIRYYALARPEKAFNRSILDNMYKSGCRYMLWGVESGSQQILDRMRKGTRIEDLEVVLSDATAAGLYNHVYILAGFPGETLTNFRETLSFLKRNHKSIYGILMSTFNLEEDSPVYDHPEEFGVFAIRRENDYRAHDGYSFDCPDSVSPSERQRLLEKNMKFWGSFNPYSWAILNFRDHALLVYSILGERIRSLPRQAPEPKLIV